MAIKLNLADVQTTLEALPPGTYEVIVAKATEETSKSSGNPMITTQLRVVGGDYDGRTIYDHFSLQTQALWKLKRFLLAAGYTEEELAEFDLEPEELVGAEVQAIVINEPYQGEQRHRVRGYIGTDEIGEIGELAAELVDSGDFDFG